MNTAKILEREYRCQSRFCVQTMRTRFNSYEHFVTDANTVTDEQVRNGDLPETVFQTESYVAAHEYCDRYDS